MAAHAPETPINSIYCYAFLINGKWKKIYTNKPYFNVNSPFLKKNAQIVINLLIASDYNVKSAIVHRSYKCLNEHGDLIVGIPPIKMLQDLPDSSLAFVRKNDMVKKRKLVINYR